MKKMDVNKARSVAFFLIFVLLFLLFRVYGVLAGAGKVPEFSLGRLDAVLVFVFFLPLLAALYFCGKYQTSRGHRRIGLALSFVGGALFVFSLLQVLLALLGFYG